MRGSKDSQIQAIADAVNICCMRISSSERHSISDVLHVVQEDFTALGFCITQLWLSQHDGSLSHLKADGTHTNLPPRETTKIIREVFSVDNGVSSSNEDQRQHDVSICSGQVNRRDTSWHDLNVLIKSSLSIRSDKLQDGAANTDEQKNLNWKSIYLTPITMDSFTNPTSCHLKCMGYIIAVEDFSGVSNSVVSRLAHTYQSNSNRLVSLLLYRLLAAAVGARLAVLEQRAEEKQLPQCEGISAAPPPIDHLSGMLRCLENLSTANQACDITHTLVCAGISLLKSPFCFVLEASSLSFPSSSFSVIPHKNEGTATLPDQSNTSDIWRAALYSAYSDRFDLLGNRIKNTHNTSLECRGLIATLLSLSAKLDKHQSNTSYLPSRSETVGKQNKTGFHNFQEIIRLKASTTELISTGLMMVDFDTEVEVWDLLCTCVFDISDTSGDGLNGFVRDESSKYQIGSSSCIYVVAYPCSSSSPLINLSSSPIPESLHVTYFEKDGESSRRKSHIMPSTEYSMASSLRVMKQLASFAAVAYAKVHTEIEISWRRKQDTVNQELLNVMQSAKNSNYARKNTEPSLHPDSREQFEKISGIIEKSSFSDIFMASESHLLVCACSLHSSVLQSSPLTALQNDHTVFHRFTSSEGVKSALVFPLKNTVPWLKRLKAGKCVRVGPDYNLLDFPEVEEEEEEEEEVEEEGEEVEEEEVEEVEEEEEIRSDKFLASDASKLSSILKKDDTQHVLNGALLVPLLCETGDDLCILVLKDQMSSHLTTGDPTMRPKTGQFTISDANFLTSSMTYVHLLSAVRSAYNSTLKYAKECSIRAEDSKISNHTAPLKGEGMLKSSEGVDLEAPYLSKCRQALAVKRAGPGSRTSETKKSLGVQISSINQTECEPEKITDRPVFNKETIAIRRIIKLNKDRKCIKLNDLKAELRNCNNRLKYSEQRMGDISVMIKGLNGTATGICTGPASLWARASPVLMSVLSSYVALGDCSLCILKGEGSMERSRSSHRGRGRSKDGHEYLRKGGLVTVLSVKELSTPVRAVYDSDDSHSPSTESSDIGCTKGHVKAQSESVLEPAVRTLIRDLLCEASSSTQQLYRIADSHLHRHDEEKLRNAFGTSSTGDQDESSRKLTFNAGTGQEMMEVKPCLPFTGDETWLVPVRTAHTVLAVLKITETSPGFMSDRDKIDFSCSEEVEGNDRNTAARDALIIFSNLLAPLLTAARQIEMEIKIKEQEPISRERKITIQGHSDPKKEEQRLKASARDSRAFIISASYNRFLYACLTLACESTSSNRTSSSGNSDKNQSGTAIQDKNVEVGSVGKLDGSTFDTSKVKGVIGVSAGSLGVTSAPTSSPIFSSSLPSPEKIFEIFVEEEDLLSKVIKSIPNITNKKVPCRLGVLSPHFNHSVHSMKASTNGELSSDMVIGHDNDNMTTDIDENGTRRTQLNRFRWYSEPPSSSSNDFVGDYHENSTKGFFTMLARQGNRTADTQADICSMTGLKTHHDVIVPTGKQSDRQQLHTTLRIFTLPLLETSGSNVPHPLNTIGVFQIALNVDDEVKCTTVQEVLDKIAAALSCNLQLIINLRSIHNNSGKILLENQQVRDQVRILLEERNLWESRSAMWESVSESAMVMLSSVVKEGTVTFAEALTLAKGNQRVIEKEIAVSQRTVDVNASNRISSSQGKANRRGNKKYVHDEVKRYTEENSVNSYEGVAEEKNGRNSDGRDRRKSTISDISRRIIDGNGRKEKYRDPGTRAVRSLKNIIRNMEILYDSGKEGS